MRDGIDHNLKYDRNVSESFGSASENKPDAAALADAKKEAANAKEEMSR